MPRKVASSPLETTPWANWALSQDLFKASMNQHLSDLSLHNHQRNQSRKIAFWLAISLIESNHIHTLTQRSLLPAWWLVATKKGGLPSSVSQG